MGPLCTEVSSESTQNLSLLFFPQTNATDLHGDAASNFEDWYDVLVPCLCAFGIIGNLLNLIIFGKTMKEGKTSNCNILPEHLDLLKTAGIFSLIL